MTTYARDILWVSPTHEIEVWSLYGMKVATRRKIVDANGQVAVIGPPWSIVGTGDFNSDGQTDILWHNAQTGHIQVWLLDGTRLADRPEITSANGQVAAIGPPWSIVGTGDFSGDGKTDILWHNAQTGHIQVWLLDGTRIAGRQDITSENGQDAAVGPPWRIVGAGDFNGNGTSDIVWYNDQTGHVQVWLLDHTKVTGRPEIVDENGQAVPITSWSIIGIGDFNGDGKSDILWHDKNPNSPQVQAWWLNGTKIALRPMIRDERDQVIGAPAPWTFVGTGLFSTVPSRLQFRLRVFDEYDSNDEAWQGASDETYLSAVGLDSGAVVAGPDGKPQAEPIHVGQIGPLKDIRGSWGANPYVLMEFDLRRPSSWPRSFNVTLLLVEWDNEDVAKVFAKLHAQVGEEVRQAAVTAATGAVVGALAGSVVVPPIGTAIGAAVGALASLAYDEIIAAIEEGLENDVLAPVALTLDVADPERIREHPLVDKPLTLDYRSKGAHYGFEYDWHLI
ncbi:MAG: VCBS repeat-containing protein [Acidobacteriota bacterium]